MTFHFRVLPTRAVFSPDLISNEILFNITVLSYANETSDLLIGYCGNDIEKIGDPNKYDNNSGNKGNFKYSFTVSEEEASQNKWLDDEYPLFD